MTNTSSTKKALQNKPPSSKWLLGAAWSVEILFAGIGLLSAWVIAASTRLLIEENAEAFQGGVTENVFLAVLPFIVLAIVGLTKIPVAMGLYYSKKILWKTILLISLIALIAISFETNLNRMERNFNNMNDYPVSLINERSGLEESLLAKEVELEQMRSKIDELNISIELIFDEKDLATDSIIHSLADLEEMYNDLIQDTEDKHNMIINNIAEQIEEILGRRPMNEEDIHELEMLEAVQHNAIRVRDAEQASIKHRYDMEFEHITSNHVWRIEELNERQQYLEEEIAFLREHITILMTELTSAEYIEWFKRQITEINRRLNEVGRQHSNWRIAARIYNIEPAKLKIEQVNKIEIFYMVLISLFVSLLGTLLAIASFVLANRAKNFAGQ